MCKAHEAIAATYAKRIRQAVEGELKNPGYLEKIKTLPHSREATNVTALLLTKVLLMGMNHALGKKKKGHKFADGVDERAQAAQDVEVLPFEEAVEYMRARLPLDAKEYYKLADKARFRAFTVSLLADGDLLAKTKNMLAKNLEEGGGLKDFLVKTDTDLLKGVGMAGAGGGWYWETVYRTGVQTAYNVGRAIGFETVPPVALELVGIGDARQTELCKSLTQPPVRRLYGDEFWKRFWPPLHFNCRTTVRAIYDPQELEEQPITGIPADAESHKSLGWGSYPLDSDKWWEELPSMKKRAQAYGVQGMIDRARESLSLSQATKVIEPEKHFDRKERVYTNQEDLAAVNPNFLTGTREYSMNCQRCVATWEMRKRGYRVTVLPATTPDELARNWASIFSNMKLIRCRTKNEIAEIKRQMKQWGDGARAEIYVRWKNRSIGHVFVAEQKDGKTYFYDPQSADKAVGKYFSDCIKGFTTYTRIDTLKVTDLILKCCTNQ